jgi:hypothetical protein
MNIQITDIFRFFFTFSVLNIISIAIAMQRIFALTKKKIFQNIYQQFRNPFGITKFKLFKFRLAENIYCKNYLA